MITVAEYRSTLVGAKAPERDRIAARREVSLEEFAKVGAKLLKLFDGPAE